MSQWFKTVKRGFLLDFQMPDADQMPIGQLANLSNIDPAGIVKKLHKAGVQALYVHAKDNQGNCYYDTAYGHKHTGLGDIDLMQAFSTACRKLDMRILYYVQLSRERRGNLVPSYAARDADGNPVVLVKDLPLLPENDERPVMCLNGPGRDYLHNILRELSENYDFDGFWLDCFFWWGNLNPCYCRTCRAKYEEDTGQTLPAAGDTTSPAWKRYFRWRRQLNTLILKELTDTIRCANPHLSITHNGTSSPAWADLAFCDADDYVSHEFHYGDGYANLALTCRTNEALKPGVPGEVEVWRFFNSPEITNWVRGYQVRPVPQLLTEMSTILANNGLIQYYDQILPDGTLDDRSIAHLKDAFREVTRYEPFIKPKQKRVPYAAILWSKATDSFAPASQAAAHHAGLGGFHHALMEKRVLHTVVTERALETADGLDGVKVLVLPNAACLSEQEAQAIRAFVKKGGGLVATYRTSLNWEEGSSREDFLLRDVFGARYLEPFSYLYGFQKFNTKHPILEDLPQDWPMTVWTTKQLKVEVAGKASALGHLVNPMRGMHMGHPPQEDTPYPACVIHKYGKGRVVYFPQPLGDIYMKYGHPDTRQLITNAVLWAAAKTPPVWVQSPDTVEVTMWQTPGSRSRSIHLVNRTANGPMRIKGSVINEIIPVFNVEVQVPFKVKKATLQPEGKVLKISQKDGQSTVKIPRLDLYGILVLE